MNTRRNFLTSAASIVPAATLVGAATLPSVAKAKPVEQVGIDLNISGLPRLEKPGLYVVMSSSPYDHGLLSYFNKRRRINASNCMPHHSMLPEIPTGYTTEQILSYLSLLETIKRLYLEDDITTSCPLGLFGNVETLDVDPVHDFAVKNNLWAIVLTQHYTWNHKKARYPGHTGDLWIDGCGKLRGRIPSNSSLNVDVSRLVDNRPDIVNAKRV